MLGMASMEVEDSADGQWWNLEPLQHFGSKVAWVSSDQIWWKIIYVAEAFQKEDHWNSYKWLKDVFAKNVENSQKFLEKQLRKCNAEVNDPGEPCVLFSRENENNLQAHICRTEGLLHFFFQWGDVCRDDNVFGSILDRMKMICASIMEFSWHLQQQFVFEKLQSVCGTHVSGGILITGFLQALKNRFPRSWLTFKTIWIELKNSGRIQADWPLSFNNTVGFVDVLMFTFSAMRWRRKQNKSTDSLQPLIALLRFDLIMIISKVLNSYIPLNVQTDFRFTIARNLPAVRRKSKSDGPVRVEVDPETIWALIESANNSGISLRQALLLKKNDELSSPELAGASESKAEYWMRKLTGLYMYRVQNVFKMITQLSLVADASTHSGKEILVSCAYSPGQSLGCHAVIQHLNTGSLKPSEVDVSVLARIAKNRKLQRMSAFRQLQAIDKQLALLSDNRLRLDAFSLNDVVEMEKNEEDTAESKKKKKKKTMQQGRFPTQTGGTRHDVNTDSGFAGHIVDPAQSSSGHVVDPERKHSLKLSQEYASHSGIVDVNEIRTWKTDSEGKSFEVVLNEMTNVSLPILPQQKFWWRFVPLLVLSLDQGPIGTAGMAFALQGHRIHVKFDKIHRCIRDYKLALGRAMGGIFLKTQLHSSYIFGLNYKPFGTSLHFNQKRTMLELFLESQTISSPLWLEFRERIAFDFGETRVVNDRVLWDSLAELNSFQNKGTLVKPSRWFSWNQCCDEFLPEFHTLKMLLKYEFGDNIRPLDEAEEPPDGMASIVLGNKTKPESKERVKDDENILRSMEK